MTVSPRKQHDERAGRQAETWAALFLRLKGYRILARRFKTPVGEIDLIARRGRLIAFIEVKKRFALDRALESVSARGRQRITRAAQWALSRHPEWHGAELRFDLVAIGRWGAIRHVRAAWE